MCCFRALWLVPFIVSAGTVHAQEAPAWPSTSERTVKVRFDQQLQTQAAEIFVAPGLSTTVEMPQAIRKKGLTLTGAEGRVSVMQPLESPNVLVLLANGPVEPGRISLAVATVDGRRYPLALATVPGRMDTRVRIMPWTPEEEGCQEAGEDPVMDVLLQGMEIAARSYSRPEDLLRFRLEGGAAPTDPLLLETIFREGNVFYLRIRRVRMNSGKEWKVREAMLEGPGGTEVKVIAVQWRQFGIRDDINVIQAEIPEGASAGYTLTRITLRGEDGGALTLRRSVVLP